MTAKIEKIVVDTYGTHIEDFLPNPCKLLFDIGLRNNVGHIQFGSRLARSRERTPIDFTVRCERERFQEYEVRRNHAGSWFLVALRSSGIDGKGPSKGTM